MTDELKKPFHEQLAEKLIERLRQGTVSWQQPWESGEPGVFIPMNPTTGRRYKDNIEPQRPAKQQIHEQRLHDWTGLVQIKGAVKRDGKVQWAEDAGVTPDFYRMYAQKKDNNFQWLSDYRTERQAQDMADRLAEVFFVMNNKDFQRLIKNRLSK